LVETLLTGRREIMKYMKKAEEVFEWDGMKTGGRLGNEVGSLPGFLLCLHAFMFSRTKLMIQESRIET
jgi:hypothetical protein